MDVFCGIDWAEDHHDVAVVDADGQLLARRRVGDDAAGLAALLTLLAEAGDSADDPIPVAIETARGLLAALRCAPPAGWSTRSTRWPSPATGTGMRSSGRQSDATDAVLLANILRTDAARAPAAARRHRAGPGDPGAGPRPARRRVGRPADRQPDPSHLLKDFYPAVLAAFAELPAAGLARPDARTILAAAPTPPRPPR